jgi:hypothetical protein
VVLCVIPALVWADTPPKFLLQSISEHTLVHSKKCNVDSRNMKSVECLIYADQKADIVYVVLFNDKLDIILILMNDKDDKEHLLWCHQRLCT